MTRRRRSALPYRRDIRRAAALERQAHTATLSLDEQLVAVQRHIDAGDGQAKRQFARLCRAIAKAAQPAKVAPAPKPKRGKGKS